LETAGFSASSKLNVFEHLLGKKAAMIPSMQIREKIEPMNGFRQRRFS